MKRSVKNSVEAVIRTSGKVSKWGAILTVCSFAIGYGLSIFMDVKEAKEINKKIKNRNNE